MKLLAAILLMCINVAAQSMDVSYGVPHSLPSDVPYASSPYASSELDSAYIASPELSSSPSPHPDYWTPRRKAETFAVTGFHLADAIQTCWHMAQHDGWHEVSPTTPNNCPGAVVAVVGEGIALQYGSHKLAQRMRWWRPVDNVMPYIQIGFSINSIRCSNIQAGCNSLGIY